MGPGITVASAVDQRWPQQQLVYNAVNKKKSQSQISTHAKTFLKHTNLCLL